MSETVERVDEHPARPAPAVLALGANLGDRLATLQSAVDELAGFEGVRLVAASPVVETEPVGGPEQPDFLNAVLLVETTLSPLELLAACQQVETDHGRRRIVRWGPRTLDVDLIAYEGLVADTAALTLPHPRAGERAFVLDPWLAADPQAALPGPDGAVPVAQLLARAGDREGLRHRPELALKVPR
ncbi:MAG TPA: 2-amino-4-hydroxy-6-hydroxymethyldihydropteridine diphosphokinase [Kineosporiaceae bacterium]|nr:2-amino-4-hydroxy-6-hydroxymethyldihydropteridine diphosphokinase [Kineosporiaceae bacterium]